MNDVTAVEAWGLLSLGCVVFGVLAVAVLRVSQRRESEARVLEALGRLEVPVSEGLAGRLAAGGRSGLNEGRWLRDGEGEALPPAVEIEGLDEFRERAPWALDEVGASEFVAMCEVLRREALPRERWGDDLGGAA